MKYMVWTKLESFSKTTHTTFSLFFDNRVELGIVTCILHLFVVTKLKLLSSESGFQMMFKYLEMISSFYSQTNNYTCGVKALMDMFFSHFYITEDDLCYPCLLKINGRIFIAKDNVSFPPTSYSILKKQEYPSVFNFLQNNVNHIFNRFLVMKDQETVLMLPELPTDLIYQIYNLYKDLIDEFSLLTFKEDYELRSSAYIFECLIVMKEFFDINDQGC